MELIKKYIISFIIIFFTIINLTNGELIKPVGGVVATQALNIISTCYNIPIDSVGEICEPGRFLCEKTEPNNPNNPNYTIIGFDLSLGSPSTCQIGSISDFNEITTFKISINMTQNYNFWISLSSLYKLQSIEIYNVTTFYISTSFPSSLKYFRAINYQTAVGYQLFTANIEDLIIENLIPGTGFPSGNYFMYNTYLKKIVLPNVWNSPTDIKVFVNLENITTTVVSPINLPDFSTLNNLKYLKIIVNYNFQMKFPSKLVSLNYLEILNGNSFVYNQSQIYDYSKCSSNLTIVFNNFTMDQKQIFYLPNDTSMFLIDSNVIYSSFNFNNITSFYSDQNSIIQNLPTIYNVSRVKSFTIFNTQTNGPVPDNYCNFATENFNFTYNQLETYLPSCFRCGYFSKFEGNHFTKDINDCNNLTLISPNVTIVPTYGGNLTFSGINLGWEYYAFGNYYSVGVPNFKFNITIPPGVGSNVSSIIKFQDGNVEKSISYGYQSPIINSYSYIVNGNNQYVFIFNGSNFDYTSINNAVISGISNIISFKNQLYPNNYISVQSNNDITENLIFGEKYSVYFKVGDQKTQDFNFVYFPGPIAITDENITIVNDNGLITFNGTFYTNDTSIVSLILHYDNGQKVASQTVYSVSPDKLTISYKLVQSYYVGTKYFMNLTIGGQTTSTSYVFARKYVPPSSSDDSSFNSDGSSFNSDDSVSNSSKKSINLLFILFGIIFTLLN